MVKRRSRLTKLVHYVCDRCGDPKRFGATKLNKVLWYADTFAYRSTGKTISGEKAYIKRQFGPVPKGILQALRDLEDAGDIIVRETAYFGKPKREYHVVRSADAAAFSEDERAIIDGVLRVICDEHTAASISDLSHDLIWEAAEMGEEIPIFAVLAAQAVPPSQVDKKWADALVKERQKHAA